MKRCFKFFLCFAVIFSLTACGSRSSINRSDQPAGANENAPESEMIDGPGTASNSTGGVDLDLTAFSSTMVYSEVYNMMVVPEDYTGRTIKMKGVFASFYDETTDKWHFACIISDATACCSQGIEFILTDEYAYPDDYPEAGSEVCVAGVFDTYKEGAYTYCILRNARLV